MKNNKLTLTLITACCWLLLAVAFWLASAEPVRAQCGSQASSCKDCHEVQAQLSVNADGTGWHQSHAFGDFCYICHGGNTQSTDKDTAHTGMVAPMDDVKASCQQCHPKDLSERAKVYADILGVTTGSADAAGPDSAPAAAPTCGPAPTAMPEPANNIPDDKRVVLVQPAETVDYVARYNENVLGVREVNWPLVGLITFGFVAVIGGAGFVATKKGWVDVSFEKPEKATEEKEDPGSE